MKFKFLLLSPCVIAILVLVSIGLPIETRAASPSSILVNMAPDNPAPGDTVTITLSSYANNLDSVPISWSVNGKAALSGTGKKTFSVTAPGAGGETDVVATVTLPDGAIDTKIVIRPATMVLLFQADDSYVPPFYRGKAFPTPGSEIKIVALPEIKSGSGMAKPESLVYAWKKDYANNQDGSGYGKNSFTYLNDYLDTSNTITVTASTTDQKYTSEASINITASDPKILFYKNDPALGTLWESALADGHVILGDEVIEAAPYFISPKDIRIPSLVFNWFINDQAVAVAAFKKNLMPIAVPAGASGTSNLRLSIESTDKIWETAEKEINLNF